MASQAALPHTLQPRLLARAAAAAYVSVSPATFDKMIEEGTMPRPREVFGTRLAWDVRELDGAIDALPHRGGDEVPPADFGWDDAPQTAA